MPLEHLADYTERLTAIFARHGTRGTWYAHASVGCLHVRPVLNLKLETRRQHHARHRRGGVRHGQGLQGLALGRARRRPGALRVPREDVRPQDRAAVRGGEGPLRSGRPDEPRQDRARLAHGRPHAVPLQARLRACRRCTPRSTGRPIRAPAAVSRARSRCATTTANAASTSAASCARPSASPATSAT